MLLDVNHAVVSVLALIAGGMYGKLQSTAPTQHELQRRTPKTPLDKRPSHGLSLLASAQFSPRC